MDVRKNMATMVCETCGAECERRSSSQKYCPECRKARRKAYDKAYYQTPKRKAYKKAYYQIPEHKARYKARKQTPEYKARIKAYYQTPERKAYKKAYEKAYYQTPKRKAYKKAYYALRNTGMTPAELPEHLRRAFEAVARAEMLIETKSKEHEG